MSADCLKLTTYFGERDRCDGRFLADALLDLYGRRRFAVSVLLRGTEGFGIHHHLQTQRLLTLSEDLPVVSVAVDARARIEAVVEEVQRISGHGLITLERARLLAGEAIAPPPPERAPGASKLTVYVGRRERLAGRPAHREVVSILGAHGVAGATVLLGVDGTFHGERRRARFVGANADVPLMVISVGDGERIAGAVAELGAQLARPLMTLERVRVWRRDGATLGEPHTPEDAGEGVWQKVMVYAGEQARADGRPLYLALVHRLREAGAAGATALRGIWGYHGEHEPHGDRFWSLRRHVPVVTVAVDTPERMRRWLPIVEDVTRHTGLVTSELVPAARATGPAVERGAL